MLKTNAKNVKSVIFSKICIFQFTHNSFSLINFAPSFQTSIQNCHLPECDRAILFFCSSQIYVLTFCTPNFVTLDEKLVPQQSCKVYFFSLKKLFFGTQLLSVAEAIIFHLGFCVHNLNTYTYPQKFFFCYSTPREVAISI